MSMLCRISWAGLAAAGLLTGCAPDNPPSPAPQTEASTAPGPELAYAAYLAAPGRLPGDFAKDAYRKPSQVLAFSKVMPGQRVFEMEAGAGYFTELLSRAVGSAGRVIMQAPEEFKSFYKDEVNARLEGNRLANVSQSWSMFDKLEAADASMDLVTWFQGPHELYCTKACGDLRMGEINAVFREVSRILKPGGFFVIMDHRAPVGTPTTSGNDLHRIDPLVIKAAATTAGFALDEESDMLANPKDDYSKDVFDKTIQGRTDQFLLRYKKP